MTKKLECIDCGHIKYWHFLDGCHNKSFGKQCKCKQFNLIQTIRGNG